MQTNAYRAELEAALTRIEALESSAIACPRCHSRRRHWALAAKVASVMIVVPTVATLCLFAYFAIAMSGASWIGAG